MDDGSGTLHLDADVSRGSTTWPISTAWTKGQSKYALNIESPDQSKFSCVRHVGRVNRASLVSTPRRLPTGIAPPNALRARYSPEEFTMTMTDTRAGFVALIGEPNAGKSTLLNRMVGAKVSIVTHKVQTTRTRIRGVCMEGQSADRVRGHARHLPAPAAGLTARWSRRPGAGASDADVIVLLIEAQRGLTEGVPRLIIDRLARTRCRRVSRWPLRSTRSTG